jgi:hypothetical protein
MDEISEGVYENDQFYHKKPADEHIQNLLSFVLSHEERLAKIRENSREAIAEAPETHYRPIRATLDPVERILPNDLISSTNENMRKILTVLLFHCDEIHELQKIAEKEFYRPIVMFGQQPLNPDTKSTHEEKTSSGYREKMIGKFLPLLQQLSNFIDRCYSVCLNLVQQLASIHDPKQLHFKKIFQITHIQTVFACLGDLCRILMTIDVLIKNNEVLIEAWNSYKLMIAFVRADQNTFNTNEEGVSKFERLLVSIDEPLMAGKTFEGCLEQNFELIDDGDDSESISLNIRGNNTFLTEMLYYIKKRLDETLVSIGTSSELNEKDYIMSSFGLYALYRRLLPRNVPPDVKLYKAFWLVQKRNQKYGRFKRY